LRIAIVSETFVPKMDGIVRFLLEMLGYLQRHGHAAVVFCPGPGPSSVSGATVVRAAGLPFPLYPELQLTLRSSRMVGTLRAWRPDIVHLAGPALLGAQGLRVARLLGLPAVGHFQTNLPLYARHYGLPWLSVPAWRYLARLHNRCVRTYAPSGPVAVECRTNGLERVSVLQRGVDVAAFSPRFRSDAVRRGWGVLPGQVVFLYAGRLAPEKNLLRLAELTQALPDSRLVVVGDGPYRSTLERRLGGTVTFTGYLHGEELAAAYASADVFAFPSLTETFGLVVLEAMASGLPVLAMRAGGVPDSVADGQTGMLSDPAMPESWVQGARRFAESPELRRAMGKRGRAAAQVRTWEATFDRLIADYREIASSAAVNRASAHYFSAE
jgi:glycosyltransferase involved in cell wall biosynthesis